MKETLRKLYVLIIIGMSMTPPCLYFAWYCDNYNTLSHDGASGLFWGGLIMTIVYMLFGGIMATYPDEN